MRREAAADRALEHVRILLGAGATVVVRGPAGIGKSTLVERALADTPHVLGQSLEPLSALPYHPLAHAFGRSFTGAPVDAASDVAAELGTRTLVIEDLQWSDDTTLDTIALLAGRVPLVLTSRDRASFVDRLDAEVIDVPPMGRPAALALARRLHPDLDEVARQHLVDLAGGSPLLIEQLVSGDVVSPTLIDAVRARVENLPTVTIEQLAVLALHGRPLPVEILEAVGAIEVVEARSLVITCDGLVTVAHALIADAVVGLVSDDTCRRIHARLAAACDDADAARHLLAAGDGPGAAERAERAADTAAPADQAQLLALAVDARGGTATARLRLDAAAALLAANQPATASAIVSTLTDGDRRTTAEAGLYRSQAAWLAGDESTADLLCAEALSLVEGSGEAIETRLLVELVTQRVRTRTGDASVIDDAFRAWEAADATGVDRARARNLIGLTLALNGRPGWEDHHLAAAAIARASGDVEQELAAMYWLVSAYAFFGPIVTSIELAAEMIERTEGLGLRRLHHHFLAAYLVQLLGTGAGTDGLVERARRLLVEDPLFRNRAQIELALAIALVDRGDQAGARKVLADGRRFVRNDEDRSLLCVGSAELASATGDLLALNDALDELTSCTRGFFGMNALAESAAVHALVARPSAVEIPRFNTTLMPVVDVVEIERMAFEAWRSGDGTEAIRGFDEAAQTWTDRSFPRFAARAHVTAGRVAQSGGDDEEAIRQFTAAGEIATRLSLRPVVDSVHRALGALERERRRSLLSSRELETLELVAAGHTTDQIAAELGLAGSTIVSHVKSARTKLGAKTRIQAASMISTEAT